MDHSQVCFSPRPVRTTNQTEACWCTSGACHGKKNLTISSFLGLLWWVQDFSSAGLILSNTSSLKHKLLKIPLPCMGSRSSCNCSAIASVCVIKASCLWASIQKNSCANTFFTVNVKNNFVPSVLTGPFQSSIDLLIPSKFTQKCNPPRVSSCPFLLSSTRPETFPTCIDLLPSNQRSWNPFTIKCVLDPPTLSGKPNV